MVCYAVAHWRRKIHAASPMAPHAALLVVSGVTVPNIQRRLRCFHRCRTVVKEHLEMEHVYNTSFCMVCHVHSSAQACSYWCMHTCYDVLMYVYHMMTCMYDVHRM